MLILALEDLEDLEALAQTEAPVQREATQRLAHLSPLEEAEQEQEAQMPRFLVAVLVVEKEKPVKMAQLPHRREEVQIQPWRFPLMEFRQLQPAMESQEEDVSI